MPDTPDKKQRPDAEKQHEPTAGPSADDRGPIDPHQAAAERASASQRAHDAHARIIKVDIEGGRTRITIGMGEKHGVFVGMRGYVPGGAGALADFEITDASDRTATAFVHLTPDQLHEHPNVVINPASMPGLAAQHAVNIAARILKYDIVEGGTRIAMGAGSYQGVKQGSRGVLLSESGHRIVSFEVTEVQERLSWAIVEATPDELHGASVILNAADAAAGGRKAPPSVSQTGQSSPGAPQPGGVSN